MIDPYMQLDLRKQNQWAMHARKDHEAFSALQQSLTPLAELIAKHRLEFVRKSKRFQGKNEEEVLAYILDEIWAVALPRALDKFNESQKFAFGTVFSWWAQHLTWSFIDRNLQQETQKDIKIE